MKHIEEIKSICESLEIPYTLSEPLKNHTSFRIGGNADIFIEVCSEESAAELIKFMGENSVKYAVIGNGSNLLVPDSGFDGAVLHFGNAFSEIETDGEYIHCQSGASLTGVCIKARENSLSGIEFAYGIPGSIGGALFMNAGAYGGEMSDIAVSARYIDLCGNVCTILKEDMDLSYRHSIFAKKDKFITSVTVKLQKGDKSAINDKMLELMEKRRSKQPLEYPSAGSTFKRPTGNYAAALIEQCGLKGLSEGDAQVSTKHSGFVINKGSATFEDVIKLTDKVKKCVFEKTGYMLELEPEILE